eukprot:g8097.t1
MEDIHKLPVKKNSSSSGDGDDETSTNSTSSPSGDSLSLPSPSPKPSKIVLAQLLNLQRELGIVNQTRIEILWNLEDSDEEVWWPATIHLDENSLHKVNTIIIEGEEEVDSDPLEFELVSIPIKYDYNKNFPEYKDEKDLLSTVSILHEHKLLENSVQKEAIYRKFGSSWTYKDGICLDGDKKTPIEQVPEKLAELLIHKLMVPFFNQKKHLLDHTKQVLCAERINAVRLIFIEELKKRQREDRSYISCLDDIEMNDLLAVASQKEREGRYIAGF